jgi:peptidoglycan/xylan/chitin deacetylase (PgdA/CDA1 family)
MSSNANRLKTTVKRTLRRAIAAANGLGLGLLLRKLGFARGGGIVMTHCVGHLDETAYLPADMKTSEAKVDRLLRALRRRGIQVVSVRDLVLALERGEKATSLVAFSMDDGYKDNLTVALPLLKRHGASGTVYVETGVVGSRVPSWMHRYFYVVHRKGEAYFAERYMARTGERRVKDLLSQAAAAGSDLGALYDFKRVLKYEADFDDRERVTKEILSEVGGDDREVARSYMTWDEVAELAAGGVEIGAHTVHHEILSRLDDERIVAEIETSTNELRSRLDQPVDTFAYPFGRTWDYDRRSIAELERLGYRASCAAMEGTNDPATPRMELKRLALNDEIGLSSILAELDGTYDFARRILRIPV